MPKILVLYYWTYGHVQTMPEAGAEGARETGAEVEVRRVPETVPPSMAAGRRPFSRSSPIRTTTACWSPAYGSRPVSDNERAGARTLGRHVAEVAAKLARQNGAAQ